MASAHTCRSPERIAEVLTYSPRPDMPPPYANPDAGWAKQLLLHICLASCPWPHGCYTAFCQALIPNELLQYMMSS